MYYEMDLRKIIKEWMLPIAMVTGASIYLIYHALPSLHPAGPFLSDAVSFTQPLLIFSMLFLTFCRIEPKDLKPHRWHWWLLLIQGGMFTLLGLLAAGLLRWMPGDTHDSVDRGFAATNHRQVFALRRMPMQHKTS